MAASIPALFLERVARSPEQVAFTVPADTGFPELPAEPIPGAPQGWRLQTLAQARANVAGLAIRLRSLGVGRGTPVAILAETSHAWCALDLAILSLGGITVGIYPTLTPREIAWQLRHCRAELLVVEDAAHQAPLVPWLDDLPLLRHVFAMREGGALPALAPAMPDLAVLAREVARVAPDDIATIVYTSGTTGEPKGVVLRHRHFLANIEATRLAWPIEPGQRSIVFLPMAHSLQRFALFRGLAEDVTGWFSPSIEALPEVIRLCRPTLLITVPRMLEKIRASARARAAERGPVPAAILRWAELVGAAVHHRRSRGDRVERRLQVQARLADRLVARKVRAGLGGELHTVLSGGAALGDDVAQWFEAMGINALQGWGLTETCAPATLESPLQARLGTVGRPLPGTELHIAPDGEVLVRGPGVFEEYLRDPQATAEAFAPATELDPGDRMGAPWFRTGDLGSIDADGFLRITGRKKAIIVTAGGKNIAPAPIEKALEGDLLGQVVVLGDERPYLCALIALDPEVLAARASAGAWPGGPSQWAQRPEPTREVQARVDRVNQDLPRFAQVKRWALLPDELSVESGELTPTLKIRRGVVMQRRQALIDGLYAG